MRLPYACGDNQGSTSMLRTLLASTSLSFALLFVPMTPISSGSAGISSAHAIEIGVGVGDDEEGPTFGLGYGDDDDDGGDDDDNEEDDEDD